MAENKHEIASRLQALRSAMRENGVDMFLATSSDYHGSEYVSDFFKTTEYFSGCTSDNVVIVVTADTAKLWTDGRYFISAAGELADTEWELMRMAEPDVPTVEEYLKQELKSDMTLGFDGRCVTAAAGQEYRQIADDAGARVNGSFAPADTVWENRPALPSHPAFVLADDVVGENAASKVARVRAAIEEAGARDTVISKIDEIMWILNIRGDDIHCNPVALSYLVIGEESIDLFIQSSELTDEVKAYAAQQGITLHEYDDVFGELGKWTFTGKVFVDPKYTSDEMMHLLMELVGKDRIVCGENPSEMMKAVKNETELKHSRECYIKDSVALCRFIYWVKKNIGKIPMTEMSAAEKLDGMRAQIPGYIELSFDTISAYNANAAMAHYAPTADHCAELKPEGFLLVDSGGTYMDGTTDVTRTIVLGKLTEEMIRDFTTVAVSNLRLLYAKFPYGTTGIGLDTYARTPFWDKGQNFNHGTGHGVGYILNVHEGPQTIRWRNTDTVFEPGMITSDEPGIYLEGKYGIRTETITECVEDETNEFGRFLRMEPLTYAPIDLEAIDPRQMELSDIEKLNDYHRRVWEKISPYLEGDEKAWLKEATKPISR